MTVRVNKSSFNIREKLSELERPIGLKGSELMRAETAQEARDFVSAGRKNLIINGDMRIDQRSNGVSTTPSITSFTSADRWKAVINPYSKFSMQRKTDGTVPGLPSYLRMTTVSAHNVTGSEYQLVWQPIEARNIFDQTAFGYSGAKDLSLSFWVRSSVPGPFSGVLENQGQNYAYVWEVNIDNANTWEYKTVNIPGLNIGSWNPMSTSAAAYLMFSLGTNIAGSANSGWVNSQRLSSSTEVKRIAISGATLDLTGVQLEVGKNATEFEHRSFGEELALCQRYFWIVPNARWLMGYKRHDSYVYFQLDTPVPMRTSPTPTITSVGTFTNHQSALGGAVQTSGTSVFEYRPDSGRGTLQISSTYSGTHVIIPSWEAGTIEFDAEL
jgi:hypothetical protein